VTCRQVKAKKELVRLVRLPDGGVEIDTTGKKAGRGAYLCQAPECWDRGLKSGHLEKALKTILTPDNREWLRKYSADLLEGVS
jgi:predicted RNA-binding protein YlxR (DUF448 family)